MSDNRTTTGEVAETDAPNDSDGTPEQPSAAETERFSPADRAEQLIHDQVNHERFIYQVPELQYSNSLAKVAEAHSRDMAEHGYFSHINTVGEMFEGRCREHGIDCAGGENLFRVSLTAMGPEGLANEAMESWVNTESHRNNILREQFTREGIGVYYGSEYIYVTQNFC